MDKKKLSIVERKISALAIGELSITLVVEEPGEQLEQLQLPVKLPMLYHIEIIGAAMTRAEITAIHEGIKGFLKSDDDPEWLSESLLDIFPEK